jgi:hypothetical protein
MGKKGLKRSCKVGKCKDSYAVKWILTPHQKKVHESIAKKGNLGYLSTCEGGPQHQNRQCMPAYGMMHHQFWDGMNERQLLVHEQKLHWN